MDTINFFSSEQRRCKTIAQRDINSANAAGFTAASGYYSERDIDLNEELVRNKPATFFMRVNSDAMKEAGIYKGDVVIVDRSVRASNGRVIIAVLNGDMLIRRFEKTNSSITLLTDSNKLSPILVDAAGEDFAIWGVVTYVIHKP